MFSRKGMAEYMQEINRLFPRTEENDFLLSSPIPCQSFHQSTPTSSTDTSPDQFHLIPDYRSPDKPDQSPAQPISDLMRPGTYQNMDFLNNPEPQCLSMEICETPPHMRRQRPYVGKNLNENFTTNDLANIWSDEQFTPLNKIMQYYQLFPSEHKDEETMNLSYTPPRNSKTPPVLQSSPEPYSPYKHDKSTIRPTRMSEPQSYSPFYKQEQSLIKPIEMHETQTYLPSYEQEKSPMRPTRMSERQLYSTFYEQEKSPIRPTGMSERQLYSTFNEQEKSPMRPTGMSERQLYSTFYEQEKSPAKLSSLPEREMYSPYTEFPLKPDTQIYTEMSPINRNMSISEISQMSRTSPISRKSSISGTSSISMISPPSMFMTSSPYGQNYPIQGFKEPMMVLNASYEDGIKKKMCSFCKKNGETPLVYTTHVVKEKIGKKNVVTCPILRSLVCASCGASGNNAHTISYCPVLRSSNNGFPLTSTTITLKNTRVKSNGMRRF